MKSLNLKPPSLSGELARHWIRGFVDGDGSIAKSPCSKSGFRLKISGLKNVLEWINDTLPRSGNCYPYKDRNSWALEAHSDNVIWLYDDSTVSLGRKRDRYLEIRQLQTS